ncbi:ribosome maturation factor RimP [Bartonella sp. DGB2]|uniref:ribosome maturation factor RimP n=1 Tax=Bartonella sp. DGB2 TaxID=3388426 RepID=UPI00398FC7FF
MQDVMRLVDINEPRLLEEVGVEAKIAALLIPVLLPLGYRLVQVRLLGLNGLTLQIMAERANGLMSVDDCELVSRTISPLLDVEDLIERKYHLEISSPGIDRPLVRKSDFAHWKDYIAKVETRSSIDGRRKFRGVISDVDEQGFVLIADKLAYGETMQVKILFEQIIDARLVLTDDLIRAALRKDKALRQGLIPEDDLGEDGV